jgi:hypothetical protein
MEDDSGFLCDKVNLIKASADYDLFRETVELLKKEEMPLDYAKICMESKEFKTIMNFLDTEPAKRRLDVVAYALLSGVPVIIQVYVFVNIYYYLYVKGPTDSAKSVTARVAALCLYHHKALCYALSEQTEVADLLGQKMLRRSGGALLSFVPGVLTDAYVKGYVLILEGFDLATPRVLTCILAALDHNTIEAGGKTYSRHPDFRLIATVNGETAGFSSNQRNILPAEVLARFLTISFNPMSEYECRTIFSRQIPKNIKNPATLSGLIADLHMLVAGHLNTMALKVILL